MTLNAYKNPIMKPIPLFLKKIPIPQLEPFLKNLPFLFMKVRGGGQTMFYVCQILAVKIISKGKHFIHKEFHSIDVQGRYC